MPYRSSSCSRSHIKNLSYTRSSVIFPKITTSRQSAFFIRYTAPPATVSTESRTAARRRVKLRVYRPNHGAAGGKKVLTLPICTVANVLIRRVFLRSGRNYRFLSFPLPLPAFEANHRATIGRPSAIGSRFFREKETWPAVRKDSDNYFRFSGRTLRRARARNNRILRS